MKKKVGIIVLVIFIIFVISKIYHFIVIKNVYDAIENFRSESNRYYSVTTKDDDLIKEEIIMKDNIVKWNEQKDSVDRYCQWRDFNNNQKCDIFLRDKTFKQNDTVIFESNILINLPQMVFFIYSKNYFNAKEFLKIKYILPINYNDQNCYKIVTDTQTLIVSRDTYLPVYYSVKSINSGKNSKIAKENTYEFKVGEVTDEDIALPNLTEYTEITEK